MADWRIVGWVWGAGLGLTVWGRESGVPAVTGSFRSCPDVSVTQ